MPSEQVSNMFATLVRTKVADMLLTCSDGIFRWQFLFVLYLVILQITAIVGFKQR